jgi:hypothetical protein
VKVEKNFRRGKGTNVRGEVREYGR